MKVDTFFSGIGGFDLAFENAGFTINSYCEIDKHAQAVLARHFPNAKQYDDIRKVGKETHGKTRGIVCGGFPCQDLSIAGKRAGLAGERSGLWFEFARVIDELEPQRVIVENVPGLLSSNGGRDFAVIIQWLVKRGYGVAWRVFDAQYFGVPQRRRRVFIVASFGNGRATEVLFEREGGGGNTPPSRKAGEDVAYSLRANPSHSGDGGINTTMVTSWDTQRMRIHDSNGVAPTLSQPDGKGGQRTPIVFDRQRSDEYGEADTVSTVSARDYKSATDLVAYNIQHNDGTGGNNVPPVGVRRLTPLECERLQGFPDGWTDGQSDTQRYKQLGNAVAVPVVEWLARRIRDLDKPTAA